MGIFRNWLDSSWLKVIKEENHLKCFPLRKVHLWGSLSTQCHVRNSFPMICFTIITCPSTQRTLQLWSKGAWLTPNLVAKHGAIHMLVL
jgi:hypothetical protein